MLTKFCIHWRDFIFYLNGVIFIQYKNGVGPFVNLLINNGHITDIAFDGINMILFFYIKLKKNKFQFTQALPSRLCLARNLSV